MGTIQRAAGTALIVFSVGATAVDGSGLRAFETLMRESGRTPGMTSRQFSLVEARKTGYLKSISAYLKSSLGVIDTNVMRAFSEVPREYFMYNYETDSPLAAHAYEGTPHPWAIGYGSYLSDYRAQAYMTQVVHPGPSDVTLEIGTGSGFQSAILSRMVRDAYSIEVVSALGLKVDRIYGPLGYTNVHTRVGDGFYGWPEAKEGFDVIIVTCAVPFVPPPLLQQLKRNGRMIIPIGQPYKTQYLYVFTKDANGRVHSRKDVRTYFVPLESPALVAGSPRGPLS